MYGFCLQDWITIRGSNSPAITSITQGESDWISLQPYQDVIFWLEVREHSFGGATGPITVNYETAPMKDESMFLPMGSTSAVAAATPTMTKILAASANVPLARWVRWRLALTGTPSSAWDVTFRICAAANARGVLG